MYLGLDLGTSGVKAFLMDVHQKLIASKSASLNVSRPHSGWSEQNPKEWINATSAALAELAKSHSKELTQVRGIGLSGQMHGATLLDKDDKVLRPCILWNDVRSHLEAAELDKKDSFRAISGNIVFPGFTAPKLAWVRNNEPQLYDKVAKVLLPKDYLRFWLTGEYMSEPSDAAGTAWFDVKQRNWSNELLEASHMSIDQMPGICEGTEQSGVLRAELAQEWGMDNNVVVAGGGGDNAASAVGMGTIEKGEAFISLGTSGVLFAANDRFLPNPDSAVHAFCHALPQRWHQMGVILSATDSLNWFAGTVGSSAAELNSKLAAAPEKPANALFLPYLSGERTPHNDASIRGMFAGLGHQTTTQELTQAVMEGVGYAFRDNLKALQSAGTELERMVAVGGGANSRFWLQAIANILNLPIDVPVDGDFGAAFGAARLGLLAAEQEDFTRICKGPQIAETIEPDANLIAAYDETYATYAKLYPAMKGLMK